MPATNESYAQAAVRNIAAALARQGGLGGMLEQLAAAGKEMGKSAIGLTPEREQLAAEAASVMPEVADPARMELVRQNIMGFGTGDLGGAAGVIAGPKAAGWNKYAAALAAEMRQKGATPDEIWAATQKFFNSRSQSFLGEIPDAGMALTKLGKDVTQDVVQTGNASDFFKAKDLIEHPELYQNYPDVGNIYTKITPNPGGSGATWNIDSPTKIVTVPVHKLATIDLTAHPNASVGGMYNAMSPEMVVLNQATHEFSHPIQAIEGIQPGGNTQNFYKSGVYPILKEQYDYAIASGMLKIGSPEEMAMREQLNYAAHTKAQDPTEAYRKLPGEVMARAGQRRMYLPSETLEARPFPKSYDVPPAEWTQVPGWQWPIPTGKP